jgi:hypothetical protein
MTKLLDNVSVDTNGDGVRGDGAGKALVIWADNFGGGSVNIEFSPDAGTTWVIGTIGGNPASFTANTTKYIVKIGQSEQIRATLTGSTGASNVNAQISQ